MGANTRKTHGPQQEKKVAGCFHPMDRTASPSERRKRGGTARKQQ